MSSKSSTNPLWLLSLMVLIRRLPANATSSSSTLVEELLKSRLPLVIPILVEKILIIVLPTALSTALSRKSSIKTRCNPFFSTSSVLTIILNLSSNPCAVHHLHTACKHAKCALPNLQRLYGSADGAPGGSGGFPGFLSGGTSLVMALPWHRQGWSQHGRVD